MHKTNKISDTPIEYLKGVGPVRAELLQKELGVRKVGDLLGIFPFRYVDRTHITKINSIRMEGEVQLVGTLMSLKQVPGANRRTRLTGSFRDESGMIELVWFQMIKYVEAALTIGGKYLLYGKVKYYNGKYNIAHPELEILQNSSQLSRPTFDPVYSSTTKLDNRGLGNKFRKNILKYVIPKLTEEDYPEILPNYMVNDLRLCSRLDAMRWIHFPKNNGEKNLAVNRLKFEELFLLQLRLLLGKHTRKKRLKGAKFDVVGDYFMKFYREVLPFDLTGAQKRVIKEIRAALGTGIHMNRLLQGDVGSGKTVVGFMSMLLSIDNGYQACMMAPTQILAQQHFTGISKLAKPLGISVGFLSGNVKGKARKKILEDLKCGNLKILIGTHALIEPEVEFENLGLAIIDEQHRFGVAQRAKLWSKNKNIAPHVLVMTATPIPRTLAMTVYGDLDVSIIDEMPPGRKEIKTIHQYESKRHHVIRFMKDQIAKGRQIYIVYPLIKESEKLDLQNLQDGYERLLPHFPPPEYQISVVHGKMKPADKDFEMDRFVKGITQIMVATTVIEVGVNVPNASVMIIENTERFGLSQLHQLRGRVGRGADQSYCILMTGYKLTKEAKERIDILVRTTNGFEIAEADLKLRGPGDIDGTMQSGIMDLKLSSLVHDAGILDIARKYAVKISTEDPELQKEVHASLKNYVGQKMKSSKIWGRIS